MFTMATDPPDPPPILQQTLALTALAQEIESMLAQTTTTPSGTVPDSTRLNSSLRLSLFNSNSLFA